MALDNWFFFMSDDKPELLYPYYYVMLTECVVFCHNQMSYANQTIGIRLYLN